MHPLLDQFLKSIGAKDYFGLNDAERKSFRQLETDISGRRLTDEDVMVFLQAELSAAIDHLSDEPDKHSQRNRDFFACEVRVLKKLLSYIDSPKVVKAHTELEIQNRINSEKAKHLQENESLI